MSSTSCVLRQRMPVHDSPVGSSPRARGTPERCDRAASWRSGSSPRARGTRYRPAVGRAIVRFIPARAGNTRVARADAASYGSVHPRARGEHCGHARSLSVRPHGSSPRARGTRQQPPASSTSRRFIPARAGNTARHRGTDRLRPVHPRARGEHACTALCGRSALRSVRFIPARAGNTWQAIGTAAVD